jgi:lipopolysaccharide transport protein LptA
MSKEDSVKKPPCPDRVLQALVVVMLMLGCWGTAAAQQDETSDADRLTQAPLQITSDKMTAHQAENLVEFSGNVRVVQEDSILVAESVIIYFHPSDKDTKSDQDQGTRDRVKKIVAAQNVEYTAGNRKAFGDMAVYTTEDQILVLTGESARLLTGTSWVSGTKITLYRKDDRAMVESDGKSRVQALFNPEDKPADQ